MQYKTKTALMAVATVLAHPFRALFTPAKPTLTLTAPTLPTPLPRAIMGTTIRADVSGDPRAMVAALQEAHNEFKAAVEANVGKKADSAEVTAKLEAIDATMNTLEASLNEHAAKIAAGNLNGSLTGQPLDPEYSGTFATFMREGSREAEEKLKAAQKLGPRAAMSEGVPADGGLLTPQEWDRTISGRLKLMSPIRAESTVIKISKAGFTKLFTDRTVGSGWVGETASRPATSTPQFTALPFGLGEIYANAAASQDLLDDAEINLEDWLISEIDTEFSRQEGIAFVSGDGTNKPFGLLGHATGGAAAARHPWGSIQVLTSGAATGFNADKIVDVVYALPAIYTPNAKFYLNRTSLGAIRKLKDGQGNFLWQPTYVAGQPSTLSGYSVIDVPDMPASNVAANIAMLFGDMRETYLVIDRQSFRLLRDPYTNKPYIAFYCTKRVGGGVKNPDSMKAIQIGA